MRGKNNLEYDKGFLIEAEKFIQHKQIIKETLQASDIELSTRGMIDKLAGIDATALIDGLIYGISLRFRNVDYNSFTLNRHIDDEYSEIHKWLKPHRANLKPLYHIQVNERINSGYRLIRVNIDAFREFLNYLIKNDKLESYYKPHLLAYEFNTNQIPKDFKGVFSKVFTE